MDTTSLIHYVFGVDKVRGAQNGLMMMYFGIGLAILISVFKHKILGLLEAMNIIQIFGDVMSYLRLYALGLSGSLVTATMNDLASGINIVFGFGLLLIAHLVNIVLGIMGGVIHGLRLNFLECYHYSFEGGGKRFNPLKKIEIE
jgi:V/A-type H+-transporting ATPase subunit I